MAIPPISPGMQKVLFAGGAAVVGGFYGMGQASMAVKQERKPTFFPSLAMMGIGAATLAVGLIGKQPTATLFGTSALAFGAGSAVATQYVIEDAADGEMGNA